MYKKACIFSDDINDIQFQIVTSEVLDLKLS